MVRVVAAHQSPELDQVRTMFREYLAGLGDHVRHQDVDAEMADLPGRYAPPAGAILLANCDDAAAGCVAMKPLTERVCEMKRFYVREAFRGRGIGLALAKEVIGAARRAGYRSMKLDTLPSMQSAMRLYESLGFQDCAPHVFNPLPGVRFLELRLT